MRPSTLRRVSSILTYSVPNAARMATALAVTAAMILTRSSEVIAARVPILFGQLAALDAGELGSSNLTGGQPGALLAAIRRGGVIPRFPHPSCMCK